jgi:hypothetical protein
MPKPHKWILFTARFTTNDSFEFHQSHVFHLNTARNVRWKYTSRSSRSYNVLQFSFTLSFLGTSILLICKLRPCSSFLLIGHVPLYVRQHRPKSHTLTSTDRLFHVVASSLPTRTLLVRPISRNVSTSYTSIFLDRLLILFISHNIFPPPFLLITCFDCTWSSSIISCTLDGNTF